LLVFFDNGAQFFTARNKHFKQFLTPHFSSGLMHAIRNFSLHQWRYALLDKANEPMMGI
jgi:hypothetical protein